MTESQTENDNAIKNEDIDSKIADFMADIDEIVLGKKSNNNEESEWKECFDETSQAMYYWNTNTNECSWEPPPVITQNSNSEHTDGIIKKKRPRPTVDKKSPKKIKKPTLIAAYTSSESESSEEENDDDIDELLNEVLDKKEKVQQVELYPLFETDCRAAIARLIDLGDKTTEMFTLRIQLETRLEDCLAGHLFKSYAVNKLEQALIQIEEFEKSQLNSATLPVIVEPLKQPLTTSEMALLLSLPPPPPPSSPPPLPLSSNEDDEALQLFYAQLNCDPTSSLSDVEKTSDVTKSEHHHHHHKDKKSKPAKTLPTGLIQKWAHAQQELHGIGDMDDS